MLKIENASIAFSGVPLFDHLNVCIESGQLACLVGESGRGKSSLLNAIVGFLPLEQGMIYVNGIALDQSSVYSIRRNIAWIPQELFLPYDSVREMVQVLFHLKVNSHVCFSEELLYSYFSELDLNPQLYTQSTRTMSGGERQRIMIAVAAMLNKPLLLIDEPTSALDEVNSCKVLHFLCNLATEKSASILAVSHNKEFAMGCQQIIQL